MVIIVESTSARCDISYITAPYASVCCSSIFHLDQSMMKEIQNKLVPVESNNPYHLSNSVFACDSFNILGIGISFSFPYSVPMSEDLLRSIKDAVLLINTAQRLHRLRIFVLIFPLISEVVRFCQCPPELAFYFSQWKLSVSCLLSSRPLLQIYCLYGAFLAILCFRPHRSCKLTRNRDSTSIVIVYGFWYQ